MDGYLKIPAKVPADRQQYVTKWENDLRKREKGGQLIR